MISQAEVDICSIIDQVMVVGYRIVDYATPISSSRETRVLLASSHWLGGDPAEGLV